MPASVIKIISIRLFRSMWSSNEASSGTTQAYIFAVFKGRHENSTEAGVEQVLS